MEIPDREFWIVAVVSWIAVLLAGLGALFLGTPSGLIIIFALGSSVVYLGVKTLLTKPWRWKAERLAAEERERRSQRAEQTRQRLRGAAGH